MTGRTHMAGTVAALLLVATTAIQPAHAYSLEGPIWPNKQVNFDYVVIGQRNAQYTSALLNAMIAWNQTSAFKFHGVHQTADPCNSNGANGTSLRANACGQAFGSGVLGITMYNYNSANRFTHAGTVFNSSVNFGFYDGALRPNVIDFRRVALHEMGHAFGMGHENNSSIPSVMQPFVDNTYRPTLDDVRGARAMYGLPN